MPLVLVLTLFILFLIWLYTLRYDDVGKPRRRLSNHPLRVRPPHTLPAPPPSPPQRPVLQAEPPEPLVSDARISEEDIDHEAKVEVEVKDDVSQDDSYQGPVPAPLLPRRSIPDKSRRRSVTLSSDVKERFMSVEAASTSQAVRDAPSGPPAPPPTPPMRRMPTKEMRQLAFQAMSNEQTVPPPKIQRHLTGFIYASRSTSNDDLAELVAKDPSSAGTFTSDVISRPSRVSSDADMALGERNTSSASFKLPPIDSKISKPRQ